MDYGFVKKTDLSFSDALIKVEKELQKEGFKILTKINVQEKFREKLNIDFPRYMILGACNPKMAHRAISAEWDIGLLLPCNVTIYEKDNSVWVGIMRPTRAMTGIKNEDLKMVADEVEMKLKTVFDHI
jgi:uncharacterized protein (DUF302 family)